MVVKRGGGTAHRAPRGKRAWAGAGRDIGPQEGGRRDGGDVRAKGKGGGYPTKMHAGVPPMRGNL